MRISRSAGPLLVVVAAGVMLRLYRFGEPILDAHAFRQTQTASAVWLWNRDGLDLLGYHVPMFGGGHWVFELPAYQLVVWILQAPLGGIESASRVVSIACYVASVVLLYAVAVRWLGSRLAALGAAAVFTVLPATVFFFRAVMVDTLAIALTLLAVYAATRIADRFSWPWFAALAAGLLIAVLVKGTIVLALGGAILVLGARVLTGRGVPPARRAALVALGVTAAALSAVWTRHADQLNLASGSLTYSTGASWFFGTTFTDPALYSTVGRRLLDNLGVPGAALALIGLAAVPLLRTGYRPEIAATLVGAFLSVGIFANLNRVHDYYQLGLYVPLSLLAGLGLLVLHDAVRRVAPAAARPAAAAALALVAVLCLLQLGRGYYAAGAVNRFPLYQGAELRAGTPDARLVLIQEGADPNEPMLWYEARRTGWRVPTSQPGLAERLVRAHPDIGAIVFLKGPSPQPPFVASLAAAGGFSDVHDGSTMVIYRRPGGAGRPS